ncbi:MBL fold metallo-hydrolase [Candidatus Jorgensenbacteria bacterium]|nr:MBL fold metallo-hydrolase [Candidatus Jorgensenbacteria bacterium]
MKITKLGHCCLVIEEGNLRILTDPGLYTIQEQNNVKNIDVILITHEHQDHLHIESLKIVLGNNPGVKIFSNKGVGKILEKDAIAYELLEHGQKKIVKGVEIEGFGELHAEIYRTLTSVDNTGYLVANKFFYPGDSFYKPGREVEILALPVGGPWLKISESVDYALDIKPKICFPVHEAMLKLPGVAHRIPSELLSKAGINFFVPENGKEFSF